MKNNLPTGQKAFSRIAAEGAAWNISLAFSNKIITGIGQVILVWLLKPSDMGLAGMAMAIAGFTAFLSAGWLGDVLVQRGNYAREAGQGFWLSIGLYFSMGLLICAIASGIYLFGQRDLFGLLLTMGICSLASVFSPVLYGHLKNDLDFKNMAVANLLEGFAYTGFSVVLAKFGFGPYSLILPALPRAVIGSAYIFWREGFPSIEAPRFDLINELLRPTLSLSLTGFCIGLQMQAPVFFVGLVTNSTTTGLFAWGWTIASQAVFLFAVNLRQVLMPVIAKMTMDQVRQSIASLKAARVLTIFLTLVCGSQAILAKPILFNFFPEKWHDAYRVITWISLSLGFQGILISCSAWLNAIGQYKNLLLVNAGQAILASIGAFWGAKLNALEGAAVGASLGMGLGGFLSLFCFPVHVLKSQIKLFLLPVLISSSLWGILYFLFPDSFLFFSCLKTVIFLVGSGIVWLLFDKEKLLKKTISSFLFKENL